MGATLSYSEITNSDINDLFRDCVRAEMKHGPRNECGAIATLAAEIGVSPQIVRLRCRDAITGSPRKKNLRERCWAFLDRIAELERAWADRVAAEVARQRDDLQLKLPLEGGENAASGNRSVARVLGHAERDVATAYRSLDVYRDIRAAPKRRQRLK